MINFLQARMHLPIVCLVIVAGATMLLAAKEKMPNSPSKHRVVFEVTTEGNEQWTAALNNVENVRTALGADSTQIEVVAHGKGLGLMLATNEALKDRMKQLADEGVVFAACENTMKKQRVTKDQLHAFVTTVDSGVAEVVRKQEEGWSYIKSGH